MLFACCTGGHGTVRRVHTLNKTLLQQAVFVPPGYTSLLYAHGYEDNSCPYNTALFQVSEGRNQAGSPTACMPKYTLKRNMQTAAFDSCHGSSIALTGDANACVRHSSFLHSILYCGVSFKLLAVEPGDCTCV